MRTKPRRPMAEWQAGLVVAGMVIGALLLLIWFLPVFLFGCLILTSVVAPLQIGRLLWMGRRSGG